MYGYTNLENIGIRLLADGYTHPDCIHNQTPPDGYTYPESITAMLSPPSSSQYRIKVIWIDTVKCVDW